MKEEELTVTFLGGRIYLITFKELVAELESRLKSVFETDDLSLTCDWANSADGETFKLKIQRNGNNMGNKLKCNKCGDIIESKSVRDFKSCKCGAISIDGGNKYTRVGGESTDILMIDKDDGQWKSLQDLRTNWN